MHIWGRKLTTGSRLLLPCARGETTGLAGHFTGVPGRCRGWIYDAFPTVAITLHLAKSLQQMESDLQQPGKCCCPEPLQPRSVVDHQLHKRLCCVSETDSERVP